MVSLVEAANISGKTAGSLYLAARRKGWQMQPAQLEKGVGWQVNLADVWQYVITSQSRQIPVTAANLVDQWTLCPVVGIVNVAKFCSDLDDNLALNDWAKLVTQSLQCEILTCFQTAFDDTTCYTAMIRLKLAE